MGMLAIVLPNNVFHDEIVGVSNSELKKHHTNEFYYIHIDDMEVLNKVGETIVIKVDNTRYIIRYRLYQVLLTKLIKEVL